MTIPADIVAEETNLQAQVLANTPLNAASNADVVAMQLNADNLVTDVQAALTPATSVLDTYTASTFDTPTTVAGFLVVVQAAEDQSDLCLLRGISGRVALNLAQF